ncbi:M6 family metalloprotease domain-containing protein [Algibacter sp. L1A34]|uniref:M6 family metalloprotease domain-containing protein n=1 Tax=Algibacter sp. L1A34 TaxID=2686365 RepID=UPI00131D644A|nr:M6 family metalloprotease domain-containing protein [Algibacter sp. L1A34]
MNKHQECLCICPPSPELEDKIRSTKKKILKETGFEDIDDIDILDMSTFTLITTRSKRTRAHDHSESLNQAPVTGTKRAIVLLVDFSDKKAVENQAHFNNMLFSQNTYATGSMRDFYKEASYGNLNVIGEVKGQNGATSGWFRAPRTKAYYTNNDFGFGSYPKNAQKCVEDVIDLANPHVNFSNYDNSGDGFVEALIVICAGTGGESSGNKSDFWSHKWGITPKNVDGVKINRYFMAPEDGRVGVMAHELGHLLCGLPDLYDTDYSSRGTGRWDLMAGGSWNNGGHTPAHPTAWCKVKCGWVAPTVVFNDTKNITLKPYHNNKDIIKLPIGSANSQEYFLLSNRQKNGFDAHLPGEGMIIEHIDDTKGNNTDENNYLVDIEQADGSRHLNTNANSGDASDVFPLATNKAFTNTSSPNSKTYANTDSKVKVIDITRSGNNITANVTAGSGGTTWVTKKITRTYASPHSKNAWAYIESIGWRKVNILTADGVTNVFLLLNIARAKNTTVTASIDSSHIHIAYLN